MLINPILVVGAVALLGFGLIYCIVNRPRLPVLTFLCLIVLIVFLVATAFLNGALDPGDTSSLPAGLQLGNLISFLVGNPHPSEDQCVQAFRSYQIADIILFAGTLISMGVEIWKLLIKPASSQK